jgi:glycerophosphoryl diester phosphodiesterase
MNLFLQPCSQPLIIAHRGSSAYAPENTLAAFQLAAEQGADAIELDVDLTRDGHAIIMHDATIDRTTDGSGVVNELARSVH